MSNEHSCSTNLLLAFLTGAVVGAAVALLTTPKSGPEMREHLRDYGDQLKGYGGQIRERAERGVDELKDLAGKVKAKVGKSGSGEAEPSEV